MTVKLDKSLDSERIFQTERTSANRWHAETKLCDASDVDEELTGWLESAYRISA